MEFKNVLYASGLSAVMMLSGCKEETVEQQLPKLEPGVYQGTVDGKAATYEVYGSLKHMLRCSLKFELKEGKERWKVFDAHCDNVADEVLSNKYYNRENLLETGHAERFDSLLREGQNVSPT